MSSEAPSSDDEFRFLAGDAARVGRSAPLPRVERISAPVAEGRAVSGLRFGGPADPEFVVLHGAGLNAHSFDPALLALDRPALSLDLPGHGRSDWRADADYRPERLAADIVTALDRLAGGPVALLGHSLGGLTAALVADARPRLVRRLVVVDITPGITPGGNAGAVVEFITGQRDYASIDEIVDRAIAFGIGSDRTALTRGVALNTRRRPDGRLEWTHHLAHLDALPGSGNGDPHPYAPIWASLQRLEPPATLVRAQHGILSDDLVGEWRDRLPNNEILTVPGPHNLHEAEPVLLASIMRGLAL
ncbi:hydrolase [Leucobacter sp. UCD-THU]|uniref:Alpha/beta hydrolase n=1 Tax=Leucobacter muris TaxID=1935379 RepID=A0ABX5QEV6_9MICO|nr:MULTISPECIES: alpha/beta hydrolase [Leucobacter]EYT53234.1 hydrolase [Leucobacter sp. UCD-THU]QAB17533.1 alpha/beta hydrolase [Leucobacter muris]